MNTGYKDYAEKLEVELSQSKKIVSEIIGENKSLKEKIIIKEYDNKNINNFTKRDII